ncbi:uncharacterized protein LOC135924081 [Gordionus sp. m RMFG-2023]|uniref:uncharacterized protein LOC135924081 n=1 Tax=Gordionus sp. m RMFG-2023 TaxID=3053472 RepID=UPI0031FE238D
MAIEKLAIFIIESYNDELMISKACQCYNLVIFMHTIHINSSKQHISIKILDTSILKILNEINRILDQYYIPIENYCDYNYDTNINKENIFNMKPLNLNKDGTGIENLTLFANHLKNLVIMNHSILFYHNHQTIYIQIPILRVLKLFFNVTNYIEKEILFKKLNSSKKIKLPLHNVSCLKAHFENEDSEIELITPTVVSILLPMIKDLLKIVGNNAIPYTDIIMERIILPIVKFGNLLIKHKNSQISSTIHADLKLGDAYAFNSFITHQKIFSTFITALIEGLNQLVISLGAHIHLKQNESESLLEIIIFALTKKSNKEEQRSESMFDIQAQCNVLHKGLILIESLFLHLNTNPLENSDLVKKVFDILMKPKDLPNTISFSDCNNQSTPTKLYMKCLMAYIMSYPYLSQNVLNYVLDCFDKTSLLSDLLISSFSKKNLIIIDSILHPKIPVIPRSCLVDDEIDNKMHNVDNIEKINGIQNNKHFTHKEKWLDDKIIIEKMDEEIIYVNKLNDDASDINSLNQNNKVDLNSFTPHKDSKCLKFDFGSDNKIKEPISNNLSEIFSSFVAQSSSDEDIG